MKKVKRIMTPLLADYSFLIIFEKELNILGILFLYKESVKWSPLIVVFFQYDADKLISRAVVYEMDNFENQKNN